MRFNNKCKYRTGIPEKWDPGPGTQDLGLGTRDPQCGTLIMTEYIETSPLICSGWFLYNGDLRHERVN